MRRFFKAIYQALDLRDVIAFGGLGMLGYGLYIIYPPAAWIVVGSVLCRIGTRR